MNARTVLTRLALASAITCLLACKLPGLHRSRGTDAGPASSAVSAAECTGHPALTIQRLDAPGTARGALEIAEALTNAGDDRANLVRALRPDSDDYAAVFDPDFAARMKSSSEWMWKEVESKPYATDVAGVRVGPHMQGDEPFVFSLTPERLHRPGSELCGRGYVTSGVEKHILPGVTVFCVGFAPAGDVPDSSDLIDALIFVHGHWALFPRPWTVPPEGTLPRQQECSTHVSSVGIAALAHAPARTPAPGSVDDARRLLQEMLDAPPDRQQALLVQLRPSHADYGAVYTSPFAGTFEKSMAPKWDAAAKGAPLLAGENVLPSPGDDFVIVRAAHPGDPQARKALPSGYAQVVQAVKPGVTIASFGFTKLGLGAGVAVDGLVFVHGRWVLMPRPWQAM